MLKGRMGTFGPSFSVDAFLGYVSATVLKTRRPKVIAFSSNRLLGSLSAALLVLLASQAEAAAQSGPTFSVAYDFFPASNLSDPELGTFEENLKIRIGTFYADFSFAPAVFSEGKTIFVGSLSYHRFDLDYENWVDEQGGTKVENAQGVEFTAVLIRQISERWNLTTVVTPGLHSDFGGDRTSDEFNVDAAVIFGVQKSERLNLGFGVAYSFKYGEGIPIPLLSLEWDNGSRLRADLLLPARAELWYKPDGKLELGLAAKLAGNQYHGDPARYSAENPQMRYSVGTFGPSAKLHLSEKVHLTADAGVTFLRRFEFFDGDDEVNSLDLRNSGMIRVGLQIGG